MGEEGDVGGEKSRVGRRETRLEAAFRTQPLRSLVISGNGVGVPFFWVARGEARVGRREERRRGRERA